MEPTADSPSSLRARLLPGLLVAALLVLAASACGGSVGHTEGGDRAAGKALFTEGVGGGAPTCGTCHTLADAGTTSTIGPDLDAAFQQSREDGLGESTFQQVVVDQIFYPTEVTPTGAPGMPAVDVTLPECTGEATENCVADQDEAAQNIGAYVASVAGTGAAPTPPAATPAPPSPPAAGGSTAMGKEVFASAGCGSCHTLADAGSSGQVGPNLDDAKPSEELVVDRVTNGLGAMPPFKGQLSPEQIEEVAAYVSSVAGE